MPRSKKSKVSSQQGKLALSGADTRSELHYVRFAAEPNADLSAFLTANMLPYDPGKDRYGVGPFTRDLVVNKFASPKAIYDMHSYWSKKHWDTIREYIKHYLPAALCPPGKGLVLDCFSGSGMTGVASLMEERPCVLVDASPAAAFISHCYTHPVDPQSLQDAYERVLTEEYPDDLKSVLRKLTGATIDNLSEELSWLYATRCEKCDGEATTEYLAYSERYQCPACAEIVPLYDCPEVKVTFPVGGKKSTKTKALKKRVCPHCYSRRGEPHRDFVISTRGQKFGPVPVLARYTCDGGCKPSSNERRHNEDSRTKKARYFKDHDLAKLAAIEAATIPHWYPSRKMMGVEDDSKPWGTEWRPGRDFRSIAELYPKRTLWAYAAFVAALKRVRNTVSSVELLQCAQTALAFRLSRMTQYTPQYSFPLPIMNGTYYLPPIFKEASVLEHLPKKVKKVLSANSAIAERSGATSVCVTNEDARQVNIPENTIDYVFTDPAYVGKIQYGELNYIWESWLAFDDAWLDDEIVVNSFRNKSIDDWDRDVRVVLSRLYTCLKPGRWLSLCYHDTDPETWTRLQNMLLDAGFEIHTVTVLDPKQKSTNQLVAEKVVKSDLVVNCRKPVAQLQGNGDAGEINLVSQRVREILVDVLSITGGQTRDHLWDEVLKRLLARGQMAQHRFGDVLAEVAFKSESGRWFLKEEFEALSESDIKNEAKAGDAIVKFVALRMVGVAASAAAEIVIRAPHLATGDIDEDKVEQYIKSHLLTDKKAVEKFKLGGRQAGIEFYDCLFFYLTRWLKGRAGGTIPRRNLAEFLDEYLVRFSEGGKWLYRTPDEAEAASLKKARQTGLGRRIRQYVSFLRGDGEFPAEKMPDSRTLVAWLKHCAAFGLAVEGVLLFEKGGLIGQLQQLPEDDRYDAEDYYAQCKRKAGKMEVDEDDDVDESDAGEGDDE